LASNEEYVLTTSVILYIQTIPGFCIRRSQCNCFPTHGILPLKALSNLNSLIRSGAALPFTAHASSPTVTMPRVKAITTGSVPSFLDVILNIAESESMSALTHQDTILAQFKARLRGRLVMYGDDTWLKLFPETFDRADGTTSFFVSVSGISRGLSV
jgi:predicted AlkP superfamily pyrophosphatase or phosphodiesterase